MDDSYYAWIRYSTFQDVVDDVHVRIERVVLSPYRNYARELLVARDD
jgi:hypothetical protein